MLQSEYNSIECFIVAVELPTICQDIGIKVTGVPFVNVLLKTGVKIADVLEFPNSSCRGGIGVLIGAYQMWRTVTREGDRDEKISLVGAKTIFGWTF